MTGRARAVFFRCFSVMFRAGVPLAQCFDLLATQSEEPSTRQISAGLADSLRAGQSLEKAMSQYPEAFAKIHLSLIVMGARSGSLDHALSHLADYEERRRALELQLRNSMTYPAIVIALTAVLLLWLPSLAMGELFEMLKSNGSDLPALTLFFASWSRLLRSFWFYVVVALFVFGMARALRFAWSRQEARSLFFQFLLSTPVLGMFFRSVVTSRFAHVLALQLRQGMPMLPSLCLAAETTGVELCEIEMKSVAREVANGGSLAEKLKQCTVFHPYLAELVRAGEEAGKLPELLRSLTILLDAEIEHGITVIVRLLEPLLLAAMGVFVGIFVMATALPSISLLKTL